MQVTQLLENISELSHYYGTDDYVKGGGGNTSVKTADRLYIKPSGTMLGSLQPESFLPMDRRKIQKLFCFVPPADAKEREQTVTEMLQAAAMDERRPSVEAPLHNIFKAVYVVHTHPALVNGMTCSVRGKEICAELFPDALWLDYADPGYTLFKSCASAFEQWGKTHETQPSAVFMENHGVFVAADSPEEIQSIYTRIMEKLTAYYRQRGIDPVLALRHLDYRPAPELQQLYADASFVAAERFPLPEGALTPDHIVYMKSRVFSGLPLPENLNDFKAQYGYYPLIIADANKVVAVGTSQSRAMLALNMAADASLIIRLSSALGGVRYMSAAARDFIENWEAESYRARQV